MKNLTYVEFCNFMLGVAEDLQFCDTPITKEHDFHYHEKYAVFYISSKILHNCGFVEYNRIKELPSRKYNWDFYFLWVFKNSLLPQLSEAYRETAHIHTCYNGEFYLREKHEQIEKWLKG